MRAITYTEYGRTPVLAEVSDPICQADSVVLEVKATGICRSDWHAWQGHDPVPSFPHVPGHEYAGVITEVGANVQGWQVGDRVVAPFALGCGVCPTCISGNHQVCPDNVQPGFTSWGSFADRVEVPRADANLVALPDAVDFVEAAALGCRFATSFRAVSARAKIQPGEWLAIHGCGGIGLSAIMVGLALGAKVIAIDVWPEALELARALGAHETVLAESGVAEQVVEITAVGAHASIDALGSVPTMRASIDCLRPGGRHVQVGLLLGDEAEPPVPLGRLLARELEILGSHGMSAVDYPLMLTMVADGRLDPRKLVGQVISIDEAGEALAAMSTRPAVAGMTVVELS